jgi:DNA-binding transcriptional LysR family regulator
MPENFRIQQIRQFLIAAQTGSFRSAATDTFRSAAAVSTAMRDLEQLVGAPLFEKGQRPRLTPLGQTISPLLSELLATHDRVFRDVRRLARAERGSLSVAVVPFLAEEWFPAVLRSFLDTHPDVSIRVVDERSYQVRKLVAEGAIDIGIAARLSDDPKLSFHPIAIDTYGIICRSDDPIARRQRAVPWTVLADRKLIGNEGFETLVGHGLGEWIDNPVISVSSRVSMMDCVRRRIGITVLPRLTKPPTANDILFVPLINPKVTRTLGIATRRGQTLLPAARDMFVLIERELRKYAELHGAMLVNQRTRSNDGAKAQRRRLH